MTPAQFEIAVRTLPHADKMRATYDGPCWSAGTSHCRGRVVWPLRPHPRCIVKCNHEWSPHTAVMDAES